MTGRVDGRGYVLQQYNENDTIVILEPAIEGAAVYAIGEKAFLSKREIVKVVLPEGVSMVGDWAFAHMKKLEEVSFYRTDISFGKKVFLGCDNLVKIWFRTADYATDRAYLSAASLKMCGERLLSFEGTDAGWFAAYDGQLLQFLAESDSFGFEPAFIGWFQDEDVDDQKEVFAEKKRLDKVKLVLQRLVFDACLSEADRTTLTAYVTKNASVRRLRMVASQMDFGGGALYGDSLRLVRKWQEMGGFEFLPPAKLLELLPEADPEVRAYLMECAVPASGEDFFAGFDL